MSLSGTGWNAQVDRTPSDPGSNAKSGDGGGIMGVWSESRSNQLNSFAGAPITNQASFDIPSAVAQGADNNWDAGGTGSEILTGFVVKGVATQPDGTPLTGDATILEGDEQIASGTVSGSFSNDVGLPKGVDKGGNKTTGDLKAEFDPTIAGIAVTQDVSGFKHDFGNLTYEAIQGKVKDYNGDPVEGVAVVASGASSVSDKQGNYKLLGPGGNTVEIKTFKGSYTEDITIPASGSTGRDFQFPRLAIRVLGADFVPIDNARVDINGVSYLTESDGRVEINDAEIKDHTVSVMDFFSADDLSVTKPGEEFFFTMGPPASYDDFDGAEKLGGIKLTVVDEVTGNPITNVIAEERNSGAKTSPDRQGIINLLLPDVSNEVVIDIADGNSRYVAQTINKTVPEGQVEDETVKLERTTEIGNTK